MERIAAIGCPLPNILRFARLSMYIHLHSLLCMNRSIACREMHTSPISTHDALQLLSQNRAYATNTPVVHSLTYLDPYTFEE